MGQTSITKIIIDGHSNKLLDITPIITNPQVRLFGTRSEFVYDKNANITLLKFIHPNKESYVDLRRICDDNRQKDFLEKMANIKTPNDLH